MLLAGCTSAEPVSSSGCTTKLKKLLNPQNYEKKSLNLHRHLKSTGLSKLASDTLRETLPTEKTNHFNYQHLSLTISVTSDALFKAAAFLFGYNNTLGYSTYSGTSHPTGNSVFIVIGSSRYDSSAGHAWLCDGYKIVQYTHYFATRNTAKEDWKIQSSEIQRDDFNHFNWGWSGKANGWFAAEEPSGTLPSGNFGYVNLKYIRIE